MKFEFKDKEFFDLLKNKFQKSDIFLEKYDMNLFSKYGGIDAENEISLCLSVKNDNDLRNWISNNVPKELKRIEERNYNYFKIGKKTIRFCYDSNFKQEKYEKLYKPGRFLDNYIFDTDPPNDYKEKEESKMPNNLGIWGMTKDDFKDGLWRNGANEMVKVVKAGILKGCRLQKMNKIMYNAVEKTLGWSITTGAIHSALGYALTYVPMLSAHPQAQRMAKELRVEGMKYVQAEIIEAVKDLVPDLLKILSTVSPEEETEKRINIEEKVETKRISAPELIEHQASIEAMAEKEMVQAKRTVTATI